MFRSFRQSVRYWKQQSCSVAFNNLSTKTASPHALRGTIISTVTTSGTSNILLFATVAVITSTLVIHYEDDNEYSPNVTIASNFIQKTSLTKTALVVANSIVKTQCEHHEDNQHEESQETYDTNEDDNQQSIPTTINCRPNLYQPKVPYPYWDYNWDNRMKRHTSEESQSTIDGYRKSQYFVYENDTHNEDPSTSTKATEVGGCSQSIQPLSITRHIILVRHGQYEMSPTIDSASSSSSSGSRDRDEYCILTPLGRRQAELTGQRLALLVRGGLGQNENLLPSNHGSNGNVDHTKSFKAPCYIKSIHVSNMKRAKETASIIASHFGSPIEQHPPDPMLNETLPAYVIPTRPDLGPDSVQIIHDHHKIVEKAFHKYIHRALPIQGTSIIPELQVGETKNTKQNATKETQHSQHYQEKDNQSHPEQHEFEIIVCHANIIRYFLCRALQLPPEAWLRFSLFNCSITYLMIQPNGNVSARLIGDTGHIPYEDTTFSDCHGYNWHSM